MSKKRLKAAIEAGRVLNEGSGGGGDVVRGVECVREGGSYTCDATCDGVFSMCYTPDGRHLAVGYGDGGIELLSMTDNGPRFKKDLKRHAHGGLAVTCIKFKSTEPHVCLASTSEGTVHVCSTIDGTCQHAVSEQKNEINCLDLNLSEAHFATAGKDLAVRVYDAETCRLLKSYEGYSYNSPEQSHSGHAQRIFALRYFPEEESVFVTGGWDNHLKIWDTRTADGVIGTIPGPHICGDSIDIKGTTLLTGSWVARDALQLWDLASCSLLQSIPVHTAAENGEFIYCCSLCDDGVVLSAGSGTQAVQAFHLESNQVLGEVQLHKPVQALATTHGGRQFAFGGVGSELKFGALC